MQSQTAANGPNHDARTPQTARRSRVFLLIGAGLIAAGVGLLLWRDRVPAPPAIPTPSTVDALTPQTVAAMDSPAFAYSDGWRVDAAGADPSEPADPWREPAGTVSFAYTGRELALQLAPGDYWGYLFVTVDGAPANALPAIVGNVDSRGAPAGYTTLYAPGETTGDARWVVVQRSDADRAPTAVHTRYAPRSGAVGDRRRCGPWPSTRCRPQRRRPGPACSCW
ncbi:MAG: hypothetical protein H6644_04555 [Caldilineaceae bacterium]|nr:hypothetical protein [Caldilineaceae bacterium]